MSDDRTFWSGVADLIRKEALARGEDLPPQFARVEQLARGEVTMAELIAKMPRLKPKPLPKSPYKESATIRADYTASEPRAEVVLKLTATKSMTTHKMLIYESEPGAVVIHKIETDHGGKRKRIDSPARPMPAFSVAAYNGSSSPISDGPYFGKLEPGESLYFTVEFTKASKFTVAVMGPLARDRR